MKQETITLKAIRENEDNPRCITEENLDKLVNSILIFPKMLELRPIVVDEHNLILGGNMRHKALTTIAGMTDEAITDRLNGMKERRGKTNGEVEALTNYWQDWAKAEYPVNIVRGDLADDEVQQRFVNDWKTAQERLVLLGGTEIPADRMDEVVEGRELVKKYIKELEETYDPKNHKPIKERYPEWAKKVYEEYDLPMFG